MKTRDELAEALLATIVGTVGADDEMEWANVARESFDIADAFVAERARRAVATGVTCDGCTAHATHRDRDDRTGWVSGLCCGGRACCSGDVPGWSRDPLATPDAPAQTYRIQSSTPGDDGEWRDYATTGDRDRAIHVARTLEGRTGSKRFLVVDGAGEVVFDARNITAPDAPEAKKPHSPDNGCAGCENLAPDTDDGPRCRLRPQSLIGSGVGVIPKPAPAWCPKRAEVFIPGTRVPSAQTVQAIGAAVEAVINAAPTPEPALKFTGSGTLLNAEGRHYAMVMSDGYSAEAMKRGDEFSAVVCIRAASRDHAEKIVAAALAAGRAVKP